MRRFQVTIGVFPAVVVFSTLSSSCFFQKKPAAFTPPPPQAQPKVNADVARLPEPPPITGDPKANVPPAAPASLPDLSPPVDRTPARRTPAPTPVHTTPTPTVTEPPAPPRLGPVFTPDQRRAYTRTLDESLERVRRALEFLSTRNLNAEQAASREKISTFQKQAEQAREQDLILAVNLAHNADVLAKDLVARVSQ